MMLSETKKAPTVLFKIRKEVSGKSQEGTRTPPEMCKAGTWIDQSTDDFFLQKKVIVFSLPGAFTPTCSSQQLPGFDEKFNEFNKYGIDAIYCISVNDSFVMNAWAEYQNIKNVKMIPDGSGTFTKEMGMLINKEHLGFGHRSWRYAMIVNNGIIEKMFIEPGKNNTGEDEDPYGETSPENILKFLKN